MKSITIIVPVYNESENIINMFDELDKIRNKLLNSYNVFFLFADNLSEDNSFNILQDLAKKNSYIRVVRYSRNFGYQRSILTAIQNTDTDAAVIIDCDMQDPPNLIFNFIEQWEKGFKNIYGIRSKRKEKWIKLRSFYYKLINLISDIELPINAGDYRLIDKIIIDKLKINNHDNPYVRGLIAAAGYPSIGISYERKNREIGKSNAGFVKLCVLALSSITHFSTTPIRLLSIFGISILFLVFIALIFLLFIRLYFGTESSSFLSLPKGLTTTWILLLSVIGLNAIFLGIIGEYISKV